MTLSAIFDVGPRPVRRAGKALFIAAFNITIFTVLDWLFGWPTAGVSINWAFCVGVFCGYFFWGEK